MDVIKLALNGYQLELQAKGEGVYLVTKRRRGRLIIHDEFIGTLPEVLGNMILLILDRPGLITL